MKKSGIFTLVFIFAFLGYMMFLAPKKAPTNIVYVTGEITNPIGDTVKFHTRDTSYVAILDSAGVFSVHFALDSSLYLSFFHGVESTAMYLNPGDEVHLTIDTELFDESIAYTGSEESSYIAWEYMYHELRPNVEWFKVSEEDLVIQSALLRDEIQDNLKKFRSINRSFYENELEKLTGRDSYISERRLILASLPQPGDDPHNFTYPDKDGNEISLSDFVGSVVYVDVWATWCGPCRAEIPFLQELEAEYSDSNVVFVGVSVDTEKNRQAWLDMMEDKGMHGVQLFADGWSEITKDYAINGIPRFMLFDANGKVADLNAPRPSSEEIRPLLDSLLSSEIESEEPAEAN